MPNKFFALALFLGFLLLMIPHRYLTEGDAQIVSLQSYALALVVLGLIFGFILPKSDAKSSALGVALGICLGQLVYTFGFTETGPLSGVAIVIYPLFSLIPFILVFVIMTYRIKCNR